LICNAHLDPVWQWEWEEGAAEALSTFRIAAKFCEEYDNFVFCHNEALLYEWIEEYDPALFKKIQELVKLRKWHIMGGWYLQPDCNMPSGESFVRQILSGKKYFYEKFNVKSTVAVNVDPFGHNRGLVQIMKKTGYNGYLFMRPGNDFIELDDEFKWVGYDDSEINAVKIKYGYASGKGKVDHKINVFIEETKDDDFSLCLWGVGNHGGGPSKTDLDNITKMASELEKDGVELIHSTPEEYFTVIENNRELKKVDVSLNPWAVGCYTSQVRVKQQYRKAENEYYLTENMCTRAYSAGLMKYPYAELKDAMRDILFVQFHDILPGSSIKDSEQAALRTINHSLEILSKLKARAFFALASGQKKASSDKIPFLAYNPYPYPITGEFEVEFNLWDQIHDDVFMKTVVCDEKGNICPSQCEKERSTIPLEWRKKVVFNATLEPMQMNRFDCGFEKIDKKPFNQIVQDDEKYIIDCGNSHFELNKKTGLIDAYSKNSVNYVKDNSFILEVFEDNYDPWYM
ncbi:MAG: alpha-mannosidase, partial [Ruminococcus sp.]|nr:alpha-mannosidase [Candidatus Copronaster equi]